METDQAWIYLGYEAGSASEVYGRIVSSWRIPVVLRWICVFGRKFLPFDKTVFPFSNLPQIKIKAIKKDENAVINYLKKAMISAFFIKR